MRRLWILNAPFLLLIRPCSPEFSSNLTSMNSSQNNRKSGTAVVTAFTAFYGLFIIDYGPREHCFSDIQRWFRRSVDGMLGIDERAAKQLSNKEHNPKSDS